MQTAFGSELFLTSSFQPGYQVGMLTWPWMPALARVQTIWIRHTSMFLNTIVQNQCQ